MFFIVYFLSDTRSKRAGVWKNAHEHPRCMRSIIYMYVNFTVRLEPWRSLFTFLIEWKKHKKRTLLKPFTFRTGPFSDRVSKHFLYELAFLPVEHGKFVRPASFCCISCHFDTGNTDYSNTCDAFTEDAELWYESNKFTGGQSAFLKTSDVLKQIYFWRSGSTANKACVSDSLRHEKPRILVCTKKVVLVSGRLQKELQETSSSLLEQVRSITVAPAKIQSFLRRVPLHQVHPQRDPRRLHDIRSMEALAVIDLFLCL